MDEVLKYFQNRITKCKNKKALLQDKIHRNTIEIDFIDKKLKSIDTNLDKTNDIFSVNKSTNNFNSKEAISLKKMKETLENEIAVMSETLDSIIIELEELNVLEKKVNEQPEKNNKNFDGLDILSVQEQERQRIARDIHDSIVQKMTALVHKSEFAVKVADTDLLRSKLEIEVINKIIKDCITELRGIIFDLRPMSLDDLGLETTLRRCIAQYKSSTDMDIDLQFENASVNINPIISITILRIVQELCSNSIKYSNGTKISVQVLYENNEITLIQEDDGIGFDFNCNTGIRNDNKSGFGLQFLKERVELLSGIIKVGKNNENKGVRYYIQIPTHNEEI